MLYLWFFKPKYIICSTSTEIYPDNVESRVTPVIGPDNLSPVDSEGGVSGISDEKITD